MSWRDVCDPVGHRVERAARALVQVRFIDRTHGLVAAVADIDGAGIAEGGRGWPSSDQPFACGRFASSPSSQIPFRAELVAKKLSDKRINNIMAVLSKPLKYAVDC